MGRKTNLTREVVEKIFDDLESKGERVTAQKIRDRAGGSMDTILPIYRSVKESREKKPITITQDEHAQKLLETFERCVLGRTEAMERQMEGERAVHADDLAAISNEVAALVSASEQDAEQKAALAKEVTDLALRAKTAEQLGVERQNQIKGLLDQIGALNEKVAEGAAAVKAVEDLKERLERSREAEEKAKLEAATLRGEQNAAEMRKELAAMTKQLAAMTQELATVRGDLRKAQDEAAVLRERYEGGAAARPKQKK